MHINHELKLSRKDLPPANRGLGTGYVDHRGIVQQAGLFAQVDSKPSWEHIVKFKISNSHTPHGPDSESSIYVPSGLSNDENDLQHWRHFVHPPYTEPAGPQPAFIQDLQLFYVAALLFIQAVCTLL